MSAIALVAAACGSTSPTPVGLGGPTPTPEPSATVPGATGNPATAVAPGSAGPASPAAPSLALPAVTSDKDLETALPATYRGVTLRKFSFSGPSLLSGTNQSNADFRALLTTIGKSPDDLSFAIAADSANTLQVSFGAYRIKGVDAASWTGTLYELGATESPGTVTADVNLGGKSVKRVSTPDRSEITYAWPRGDVLFLVIAMTDALAADAIASMP